MCDLLAAHGSGEGSERLYSQGERDEDGHKGEAVRGGSKHWVYYLVGICQYLHVETLLAVL